MIHTSEVLASPAIGKLFDELRNGYEYIVVDFSPLAPVIDVRASAHIVDIYFLVVEWGRTKIDVVEHALKTAPQVYESLAGVVLNKTDMDYIGRYDNSRAKYYKNKHYGRYGYGE